MLALNPTLTLKPPPTPTLTLTLPLTLNKNPLRKSVKQKTQLFRIEIVPNLQLFFFFADFSGIHDPPLVPASIKKYLLCKEHKLHPLLRKKVMLLLKICVVFEKTREEEVDRVEVPLPPPLPSKSLKQHTHAHTKKMEKICNFPFHLMSAIKKNHRSIHRLDWWNSGTDRKGKVRRHPMKSKPADKNQQKKTKEQRAIFHSICRRRSSRGMKKNAANSFAEMMEATRRQEFNPSRWWLQ